MQSDKFFFFAISTFHAKAILCQTSMSYCNKILAHVFQLYLFFVKKLLITNRVIAVFLPLCFVTIWSHMAGEFFKTAGGT